MIRPATVSIEELLEHSAWVRGLARQLVTDATAADDTVQDAWVAALAHVLDGHGEQVAEPEHGRLRNLLRLRAQPVARLLGDRQRARHLSQEVDEHQMP